MAKQQFDHVIVGSGINALVCAALLGKAGHKVCVLERNERIGGCIRTEQCTVPGFVHDVFSQWYPLFLLSPGYAELGEDLTAHGLEFAHSEFPTASLLPDDSGFVLPKDRVAAVAAMNRLEVGVGDRYAAAMQFIESNAELTFALLGDELWRWRMLKVVAKTIAKQGPLNFVENLASYAQSARHWLAQDIKSDPIAACIAPWVLHAGFSPDSTFSGHMAKVICFSLELAGTPVVVGGSENLLLAFRALIEAHGGVIKTDTDVVEVEIRNGRACGVRSADGESYLAKRDVICSTTPDQLYNKLLAKSGVSESIQTRAGEFRHGLADMQIHLALDELPSWSNPAMNDVAMVHLSPGVDGISRAVNEATRGLLPDQATVVVGQPCALDPSRAPQGKATLWIQLQELPAHIRGDARGELVIPNDGRWNDEIKERYADRIIDRIATHIPKLKSSILGRRVFSPADLEATNINLVGGDPYGGDCQLDQFLFARPLAQLKNHETPFKHLYHIGASTHPGPGLGGGSGYLVAKLLR